MAEKLIRPGFEWAEHYNKDGLARIYLQPVAPWRVRDRHGNGTVKGIQTRGQWTARAFETANGDGQRRWYVTTQAGGKGGRRYRTAFSEDDARAMLAAWYERRFRYVDIVPDE